MGRGRQKAKHQKVARELKYHSTTFDTSALERELAASRGDDPYEDRYGHGFGDSEDEDDTSDYVSPSRGY